MSSFPTMFFTQSEHCIPISPFVNIFHIIFAAELEEPKTGISGKGLTYSLRGVCGREVEHRHCNHEVPSSSPWSGSQLWDISLAHTLGVSTGVVPRKQNGERLV